MMEKYSFIKVLGEGSFGAAWLVARKSDGLQFAAKEIRLAGLSPEDRNGAMREVSVLSRLHHPNIIRYEEHFMHNRSLFIVMEYADNRDLYSLIQSRRGALFTEEEVLRYFSQLCLALSYLHEKNVLHRDIKSQNVFLTKMGIVKLGDFGISTVLRNAQELHQTVCGTPYYFSPEMCLNQPYNNKSDVWALGCILYEIATLRHAFDANNMYSLIRKILKGVYPPISTCYSPSLSNLIASMIKLSPEKRPYTKEILDLPFISSALLHLQKDLHSTIDGKISKRHPLESKIPIPGYVQVRPAKNDGTSFLSTSTFPSVAFHSHRNGDLITDYKARRQEALLNKERCYREELGLWSPKGKPPPLPLPYLSPLHRRDEGGRVEGASSPEKGRKNPCPTSFTPYPSPFSMGGRPNEKEPQEKKKKSKTVSQTSERAQAFWQMRMEAEENKLRLRLALQQAPEEQSRDELKNDVLATSYPSSIEGKRGERRVEEKTQSRNVTESSHRKKERSGGDDKDCEALVHVISNALHHLRRDNEVKCEETPIEILKDEKKEPCMSSEDKICRRNDATISKGVELVGGKKSASDNLTKKSVNSIVKKEKRGKGSGEAKGSQKGEMKRTDDDRSDFTSTPSISSLTSPFYLGDKSESNPETDAYSLLRLAEKVAPSSSLYSLSPTSSLMYRIETLRLFLENEMGEDHLLSCYKAMNNITANEEDHTILETTALFPSAELQRFIPFITQLIVCEDILNEKQY